MLYIMFKRKKLILKCYDIYFHLYEVRLPCDNKKSYNYMFFL